jgi:class 3 adenylate cyclase/YHS domain-containing protein
MIAPDQHSRQTFLFADLAGFTALTEAHGDEQAADLVASFCRGVRVLLPAYGGEEVKTIGDAVMVRVPKAGDAVRLGLAAVDDARRRPRFPIVRVGMNTGSAVERDGDWYGAAVNLAARVAAAAKGNEVLLTGDTRLAAGALQGVEFEARGWERFHNVAEPVELHRAWQIGASRDALAIDPVCQMAIAPEHCAGHLRYENRDYCFCSLECAAAFAAEPARYVHVNTDGSM